MELSKEELTQIIKDAIHEDRNERVNGIAEKVIDYNDIESPSYNTNKLFVEAQRTLKGRFESLEQVYGELPKSHGTVPTKWDVERKIRELVFAAFGAKNSRYIPAGFRQQARDLYESLSDAWFPIFDNWCSVQKAKN